MNIHTYIQECLTDLEFKDFHFHYGEAWHVKHAHHYKLKAYVSQSSVKTTFETLEKMTTSYFKMSIIMNNIKKWFQQET